MLQRTRFVSWLTALALVGCARAPEEASTDAERRSPGLSRIREIEDHRLIHDPELGQFLAGRSPTLAAAALVAVGRIGDTTYADRVIAALGSPQSEVRRAAGFAAGLLGGDAVIAAVVARLGAERDVTAVTELCMALGHSGGVDALSSLAPLLEDRRGHTVRAAAAQAIGLLGRAHADLVVDAATLGRLVELAGSHDERTAESAAFALASAPGAGSQFSQARILEVFRAAPHAAPREHLIKVLGRIGSRATVEALATAAARERMPTLRAKAVAGLGAVDVARAPELLGPVLAGLIAATRDPSSQVAVAAARALAAKGTGAPSAFAPLAARFDATASSWLRTEILPALVAIDAGAARSRVDASVTAAAVALREAAVVALGSYATDADVATLSRLASNPNLRVAAAAINTLSALPAERISAATKEAVRARIATRDVSLLFAVVTAAASFGWTDFLPQVIAIYPTWTTPTEMDGRIAVLSLVQELGTRADLAIVEQGLNDAEKSVVEAAAAAFQAITGIDVTDRVPLASRVTADTPSEREIDRALARTVRLRTVRGVIELRMHREAALTATSFVHLVEDGFYDGIEFHRVEPAFVIQGGDPTGTGFSGSDALIREEISSLEHHRGTVGIATAGKDTGSSQFFVNSASDLHLDRRFTVFADVIEGMDVVDRIEVGDEILSASAF